MPARTALSLRHLHWRLLQVDMKRLPDPALVEAAEAAYVAPRTSMECTLQGIWQQLLGLAEPPSVEGDFFNLGGTSLLVRPSWGLNSHNTDDPQGLVEATHSRC